MLKLRNVVLQMKDEEYLILSLQLKKSNASKLHTLFVRFRENSAEEEIRQEMGVSQGTFYTLKSRLYSRIQEFMASHLTGHKTDLLENVAGIPRLLFETPRDTAISHLRKLEKDLLEYDMPYELTNVYSALKRLHLHSPKFYEFSQRYNQHLAYTIALDKAEDLLASFHKTLGDYDVSRDKTLIEMLWLIKREMADLCRLYESHHLTVYRNIMDVAFALFVPFREAVEHDDPVEDLLKKTEEIINTYKHDSTYAYLKDVIAFLWFEYYHHLGLSKKAAQYFDPLNGRLSVFLLNNFCCFSSRFLLSKAQRYILQDKAAELYEEHKKMAEEFTPDPEDAPGFISFMKCQAAGAFYTARYQEAVSALNDLLNKISFRSYPHAEMEVKLMLALSYSMINKYDLAHNLLRSVSRKVAEIRKEEEYENVTVFCRMLNMQMDSSPGERYEKLVKLRDKYELLNKSELHINPFLRLSNDFIKELARPVK